MADRFVITDMAEALLERRHPSIVLWNRLEGRPRTTNFERSLRGEVRDALWMLTRQWQAGEFRGEDAGSPVSAKLHAATTRLTRFQPGDAPPADFDDALALEARVEQQPIRWTIGTDRVALDLRLALGQRWLRLIQGIGSYEQLYITKYKFALPDPTDPSDAPMCAHPEVWQSFAAVAGRAMDGGALYQYLTGGTGRHAYDGIAVLQTHKAKLDLVAEKFLAWVERSISQPPGGENPAWRSERLEYRFACAGPTTEGEKVYVAEEYYHGTLDWYSLNVALPTRSLGSEPREEETESGEPATPDPRDTIKRTMIPVPLGYPGMPHPRWWTMEDRRTNFGEIRPDTTDLAKLLFIEFGLVYSNDWFIVPLTLPATSLVSIRGLAVSNVFGERFWIEPAGSGAEHDWERWSMFTVSPEERGGKADSGLVLLPTLAKIQEGAPLEHIVLMRDEMANMVWAIEKMIPGGDGTGRSGITAARETRSYFENQVAAGAGGASSAALANQARLRYQIMSTVPEHWIPFIPVRSQGSQRSVTLQRAGLPRILEGSTAPPVKVRPRTSLLRTGLDQASPQPYLVPEEEIPRAGAQVTLAYQRTRWADGKALIWIGARKRSGRGEGSSGLVFDRLADVEPIESA
jgi:hypothetical protein